MDNNSRANLPRQNAQSFLVTNFDETPFDNNQNKKCHRISKNSGKPQHFLFYIFCSATITTFDEQLMSQGLSKIAELTHQPMSIAQWLSTLNFIATAISAVPLANIGQIVGQVNFLIVTYVLLAVSYCLCGAITNFWFLLVMRFVTGALNSGAFANRNIIFVQYPQKQHVQTILQMSMAIPSLLNVFVPFLTGYLISIHYSYQFYILAALCFLSAISAFLFQNIKPQIQSEFKFDFLGVLFMAVTVGLFCLATVEFSDKEWELGLIFLSISLVGGVIFVFVERKAVSPILPIQLLRRPRNEMLMFNLTGFMKFIAMQYLLPQYLPYLGIKGTQVGAIMTVSACIGFVASLVVNNLIKQVVIHIQMKISSFFSAYFIIFQALFNKNLTTLLAFYWFGFYFDSSNMQYFYSIMMQAIPREFAVYVGGLPTISRTIGQSIATCLCNCMYAAFIKEFDPPQAYTYSMLIFSAAVILQFVFSLFIGSGDYEEGKMGFRKSKINSDLDMSNSNVVFMQSQDSVTPQGNQYTGEDVPLISKIQEIDQPIQ